MKLYYNVADNDLPQASALFNGNIAATRWQSTGALSTPTNPVAGQKAFIYSYDKLNRVKTGTYSEVLNNQWIANNKFSENINLYDLNGNIKSLTR